MGCLLQQQWPTVLMYVQNLDESSLIGYGTYEQSIMIALLWHSAGSQLAHVLQTSPSSIGCMHSSYGSFAVVLCNAGKCLLLLLHLAGFSHLSAHHGSLLPDAVMHVSNVSCHGQQHHDLTMRPGAQV
jgi:hypothetical protein